MGDADAEREQATMKKQMRLLEGNRRSYAGDAKSHLQKQQDTMNALKKENEKFKEDLAQAAGLAGFNQKHQAEVTKKTDDLNLIQRKLDHEMREARKWEAKNEEKKKEVFGLRKERKGIGGVNSTQENHLKVEKQIKVLENRLDQALVKFNEALSHNKELREQIDNLRRERVVFDGIYKKLEKELHEKKKQMAEIIEKSNLYYEERDAAGVELKHLRESAQKDIQQYEDHFKELDLMIEANKNLERSIKSMRNQTGKTTLGATKSDDEDEPGSARKRKDKAQKQEQEQEQEVRSTNYQDIVDALKEKTGIQDMEVLLQKFVKAEEQNFSMYNFVNELNDEIDKENKELDRLREITVTTATDSTRMSVLKDLEDELSKAEGLAESLNEKTAHAKEQLDTLRGVIWDIYNKIGSSSADSESLGTSECTEHNMMVFLGMIEQRTNGLLNGYQMAKASEIRSKAKMRDEERRQLREKRAADRAARREQGEDVAEEEEEEDEEVGDEGAADAIPGRARFIGAGPQYPSGQTNLAKVVEQKLPAAGDTFGNEYDGVDGEDERVFSQEELRQQTEQRLARQQNREDRGERGRQARGGRQKGKGLRPAGKETGAAAPAPARHHAGGYAPHGEQA